jgi:hypothetical protein
MKELVVKNCQFCAQEFTNLSYRIVSGKKKDSDTLLKNYQMTT